MHISVNYVKILTTDSPNKRTSPAKCYTDKEEKVLVYVRHIYFAVRR